jgi:hypothetical protein
MTDFAWLRGFSSSRGAGYIQFGQQAADLLVDPVADRTYGVETLTGRVG